MKKSVKKSLLSILLVLFSLLVMVSPVLANTSNWWFLALYDRYYLNGENNGVYHSMDSGNLTISGSIWVTMIMGGDPPPPEAFYFQVWKNNTWFDTKICTSGGVTPSVMVGPAYAESFSKNCGSISSGDYYLVIWRGDADDREVEGSGTLVTN